MNKFFLDQNGDLKWINIGIVSAVVLIFFTVIVGEFFATVSPSYKGVVISGGKLQDEILEDGFHTKVPFWEDIQEIYVGVVSTDDSPYAESFRGIQPLSKDGQIMHMDVQIEYAITDPVAYRRVTGTTEESYIQSLYIVPTLRKAIYDYTANYTWSNLIQGGDRQEFGTRLFETISTGKLTKRTCTEEEKTIDPVTQAETIVEAGCKIEDAGVIQAIDRFGVVINAVNLRSVKPNENIISAVEEAQKKEQEVKIAKQEAEIAREQANMKIEQKRGETESQKLEADATAYKIRVEKEEEAKGITMLAEAEKARAAALQQSQQLVEYKRLEIDMKKAEALIEFAKHYTGQVPDSVQIIGTDEAKDMQILLGQLPGVSVNTGN